MIPAGSPICESGWTWTADPDASIEKVRRGKQVLKSIH
jgi:hypothetical protein